MGTSDPATFVVTREWLHSCGNRGAGFPCAQLAILGVPCPPQKGWLTALVGTRITWRTARAFESYHQHAPLKGRLFDDAAAMDRDYRRHTA